MLNFLSLSMGKGAGGMNLHPLNKGEEGSSSHFLVLHTLLKQLKYFQRNIKFSYFFIRIGLGETMLKMKSPP